MIAQILLSNRRSEPIAARSGEVGESRVLEYGARCARIGLAIALAPALLTMLVVGGVGALVAWAAISVVGATQGRPRPAARFIEAGRRHDRD